VGRDPEVLHEIAVGGGLRSHCRIQLRHRSKFATEILESDFEAHAMRGDNESYLKMFSE